MSDITEETLPRLRLTAAEFKALPEYSCSLPTGTTIGKRWKRLDGAHDRAFKAAGGKPRWMVGEFHDIGDPKHVGIRWFKPVVVVRAA